MSSTTASNPLSLCIPRVFVNITEARIARCFALALGCDDSSFIDRIDMIKRGGKDGQPEFWRVFIHLHRYPESENGEYFQQQISEGKTVTIVYDDPWYWKVSMSRISKPKSAGERVRRPPVLTRGGGRSVERARGAHRKAARGGGGCRGG